MNVRGAAGRIAIVVVLALVWIAQPERGVTQTVAGPAKTLESAQCDRAHFRLLLDVGHSAEVPGAMSARNVPEFRFNLRLAKEIDGALIGAGFEHTELLVSSGRKQ